MIVSKQAQQEQAKVTAVPAQAQKVPAQPGQDAFAVILDLLGETDALGQGASDSTMGPIDGQIDQETTVNPSADQIAATAKIADWLAANPASLAALNAVAGSTAGSFPSGFVTAWFGAGVDKDQTLEAFSSQQALVGALSSGLDPEVPASGSALVASMPKAGDSQLMAAALMGAIGSAARAGSNLGSKAQSSNELLTHSIYGDLSLADMMTSALVNAFHSGMNGDSFVNHSVARGGLEALENASMLLAPDENGLAVDASLKPVTNQTTVDKTFEQSRQIVANPPEDRLVDQALLANGQLSNNTDISRLQQAIGAQELGRFMLANASGIEGAVSWLASRRGGSATIDLTPPELGRLRLELKIDAAGENANLVVHAATDAARAAIEQSLDRLYDAIQSSGLTLQVSVGGGSLGNAQNFSNGLRSGSASASSDLNPRVVHLESSPLKDGTKARASDALSLYA
ncbi:MAG: flagellar hook-length control protein FliK [Betaproteobacteria bacterium]|nr:flagellar hook-length control protein FliK [Betaproteobacteria bacterium]